MHVQHFNEARDVALRIVRGWIGSLPDVEQTLLVRDLFGKLSL